MSTGARLSQKKSPELRDCANPKCEYAFYGFGNQKYCCIDCRKEIERPKIVERTRKWRRRHPERYKEINKEDAIRKKEKQNDINV